MVFQDLTGQKFGHLLVIERDCSKERTAWLCQCDCGNQTVVASNNLKRGHTSSCGCRQGSTHGLSENPIYYRYFGMKARCRKGSKKFKSRYYDRGIRVCKEWSGKDGFIHFYEWAIAHGFEEGLTLDRIDNSKGYSPENCRWATPLEQVQNRDCTIWTEYKGETMTLKEASRASGICYDTLRARHDRGLRDEALFNKSNLRKELKTCQ